MRESYSERHNYDLKSMCAELKQLEAELEVVVDLSQEKKPKHVEQTA